MNPKRLHGKQEAETGIHCRCAALTFDAWASLGRGWTSRSEVASFSLHILQRGFVFDICSSWSRPGSCRHRFDDTLGAELKEILEGFNSSARTMTSRLVFVC